MELWRRPAASTFITFPLADATGFALSNRTITGTWIAWSDTVGPYQTPGFQNLSGLVYEIPSTAVYTIAIAATELPTASPYVLMRFTDTSAPVGNRVATQYLLVRTSSQFADVTGINNANLATPVTAGYMPIDVKQTIALASPTDNSIEKSLARSYMAATHYVDAAISSRSAPATAQTIDQTTVISGSTDNSIGKVLSRLYHATTYLDAAISTRSAPATAQTIDQTTVISGGTDNSIGKVLARLYHATTYLDAAVSSRSAPATAQTIDQTVALNLSAPTDNSIGKALSRMYFATDYLQASVIGLGTTLNLSAPTDNTVGKALSRVYFATSYLDAAVSSRSAPATAQTIDQTTVISGGTDNSIGKVFSRLYHATTYLDAAVSTRSTYAGGDTAGTTTLLTRVPSALTITSGAVNVNEAQTLTIPPTTGGTMGRALVNMNYATVYLDAAISTAGSTYADAFLGRTLTRGASGGRNVQQALQALRNRVNLSSGTLTVYSNDDTTTEWTAAVATQAVTLAITDINPV